MAGITGPFHDSVRLMSTVDVDPIGRAFDNAVAGVIRFADWFSVVSSPPGSVRQSR
jgi:hypothetical protein